LSGSRPGRSPRWPAETCVTSPAEIPKAATSAPLNRRRCTPRMTTPSPPSAQSPIAVQAARRVREGDRNRPAHRTQGPRHHTPPTLVTASSRRHITRLNNVDARRSWRSPGFALKVAVGVDLSRPLGNGGHQRNNRGELVGCYTTGGKAVRVSARPQGRFSRSIRPAPPAPVVNAISPVPRQATELATTSSGIAELGRVAAPPPTRRTEGPLWTGTCGAQGGNRTHDLRITSRFKPVRLMTFSAI
jgi:hypothetical protein